MRESFIQEYLEDAPIAALKRPILQFLHIESASGVVLAVCTAIALICANTSLSAGYQSFWETVFHVGIEEWSLSYPLWYWVNDGLMTIFFFVIGLEIKRELTSGELSDPKNVMLPVAAACGGALLPAIIYAVITSGAEPGVKAGWAIPMATDIAFVVGCLAILGSRVPHGLKVLLLTLAIVDDILAVLVIALFYSHGLEHLWLLGAVVGFGVVLLLQRAGSRSFGVYTLWGAAIWLCLLKSGIHPTVGGVFLGLLTPARPLLGKDRLVSILRPALDDVESAPAELQAKEHQELLETVSQAAAEGISPLERLETALHPWVSFGIMPLFALANAAVPVSLETAAAVPAVAVGAGLLIGKPIGIVVTSFVVVKMGLAKLPGGVNWPVMVGAGCLAGIGFTMSLFIASLGLEGGDLLAAKAGILLGSAASAVLGFGLLMATLRTKE